MEAVSAGLPEISLTRNGSESDEPLVDAVYNALRDAICDGRLASNQKLPQIPLAEHLGISRTPVRDALQRLAQEGLVRAVSFRGFVVSEFSTREVLDVYQVRIALEPMAVGEAFPSYTRMDLARLGDLCDRMQSTDVADLSDLYALNGDFHRVLVEPCPNRVAVRTLTQLWALPSSLRVFHAQASSGVAMRDSVGEHRQILAALEKGDRDLAVKRVEAHIRKAEKDTIAALDEG
ncbi:MAG: GntR family transcriptional regulator [Actinobacteria bacterium]|nr:GntR family transcriptional regulator [Actinomycetota bacterium]